MAKKQSNLLKAYNKAVDAYTERLLAMWGIDGLYCYWVSDDRSGVFCVGDDVFLNVGDVISCVEGNYDYRSVCEWQEYNVRASKYGLNNINLVSWFMGAPRTSEATFRKFEEMEKCLSDSIQEEKERIKKETK